MPRLRNTTTRSSVAAWKFLCTALPLLLVANAYALITNVTPSTVLTPVTNTTSINLSYTPAATSVTEQSTQAFLCTTVPAFNQSGGAFASGPTPLTPNSFCLNTQAAAPGAGTVNLAAAVAGGEIFTMTPGAFTGLYDGVGGYATVYFVRVWFDNLSQQTYTVSRLQLVPTLTAAPDTLTVAAGGSADVLANDFIEVLNASASNVVLSIVSNGGLTGLSVAGAQLLVPSNANAGAYTVTYRICDAAPGGAANCVNGTANLTVTAVPNPQPDSASVASALTTPVTVLTNDTIGANPATTTNSIVNLVTPLTIAGLTVNAAGQIVAPPAAPGAYAIAYRLCNAAAPAVCAQTTLSLTVASPVLVANADSAALPKAGGTVTVLSNDTIDGIAATSDTVVTTLTAMGGLSGLTINGAGAIVVPASAAGSYTIAYRICAVLAPSICANSTVALILAPVLVAGNDSASLAASGGVVTVLGNDTVEGVTATTATVVVSIVTTGGLTGVTVNAAGALVVPAAVAGSYVVTYRICDQITPTNCATATATITVSTATIAVLAANDSVSLATTAGGLVNVLSNDTVGGAPATTANGVVTLLGNGGLPGLTFNAAGQLVVPPFVAGIFSASYRLCAQASPTSCANATVAITLLPTVTATADSVTLTTRGGAVNVLSNDRIDAAAASTGNATVTLLATDGLVGITVNAAGELLVPPASAGRYNVSYRICSRAVPGACAAALAAITLLPTISATADNVTLPNVGGDIDVLANDSVSGAPATTQNVTLAITATGGLSGLLITPEGKIRVPLNAPGNYVMGYRICSVAAVAVCAVGSAAVLISSPAIVALPDTVTLPSQGGRVAVLDNDTYNGVAANSGNVVTTLINTGALAGLAVDASGGLLIPAATPGNYQVSYRICAVSSSATCASAVAAVTIANPVILLVADTLAVADTGGVLRVLGNDFIAGVPATATNALVSVVNSGGLVGVTVNSNAELVVPANNAGSYQVTYRVCARSTPAACAESTLTLSVTLTTLAIKLADDVVVTNPFGATFNVLANDTVAGRPIIASAFTLSLPNNGGVAALKLDEAGVLTIPAVINGVYLATYRVCQKNLASNCADAKVRITVTQTQGSVSGATRRPPSVPGAATATYTASFGASSPTIFAQAIPSSAGAANSPLILGETRLGYGANAAGGRFQSYRSDSAFEPFGAQFQYSGTGTLNYRWEVVRPGEPNPDAIDLYPEQSLSLPDRLRQTRYAEIARGQVFLPAVGRYFLRGPDAAALPRSSEGNYLILLRIEASTASVSGGLNGATAFPIQPLTYVMVGDRGVTTTDRVEPDPNLPDAEAAAERRRLSGGSSAAEFSNMGQLPDAGPALSSGALRFRSQGDAWKTLQPRVLDVVGASIQQSGAIRLSWKPDDNAAVYRVFLERLNAETLGATSSVVALAKPGSESGFEISLQALGALTGLPKNASMRWRVAAYSANAKVVAISDWSVLKR